MAYQPKSYRKFIAGAAAVAVVAPVVAPVASLAATNFTDVEAKYKDAVDFLVSKGINGTTETTFGTQLNIKRVDAAVFVAQALELDTKNAPDAGFTDVPARAKGAVNALKEAKITSGKTTTTFASDQEITRGELAIWLQKAFDLKAGSEELAFTDVSDRYEAAVKALVSNEITSGTSATTFGTEASAKRGDFALFIKRAVDATTEVVTEGITSVSAINDTKFEVTFGQAIDEDLAVEIEKSGKRFVIYDGGQTVNSTDAIQSSTINFNADRTKAEVIIADDELRTDVKYKVALVDGDNNTVASTVYVSEPTVLKKGAEQPVVNVNKEQDKVVLDFKVKMDAEALDVNNYTIYENDELVGTGNLSDFVDGEGEWVDATDKKAVEFKLEKGGDLLAGKTYKIKVADAVETDNGKKLSASQKTITFKTPSVSEAQPEAKIARISNAAGGVISVTFDQDLADGETNFNKSMITVKQPGGKTANVTSVVRGSGDKEVLITVEGSLDVDLTYTIELPANGVNNAYFANAANKATSSLKAQAQKDVEITSVSAKFVQQVDNKDKADLLLTFDQRPNASSLSNLVIKEGSDKWSNTGSVSAEYYSGDATGKTLIIKNVTEDAGLTGSKTFTVKSDKTYTVEIEAGGIQVDAGSSAKTNQEKLKATTAGVSVGAPKLDGITLKSASEIAIDFTENIDVRNLKASDVEVAGYELQKNGKFVKTLLTGDSQIKVSASGKTLTLKAANEDVKFMTSLEDLEFTIDEDTFMNASSKIENDEIVFSDTSLNGLEAKDLVDRAKPVMVGAKYIDSDAIEITYTEAIEFKGSDAEKAASQFTVNNASKNAYGVAVSSVPDDKLAITFNEDETFKSDLDLAKVQVKYAQNVNVLVKDAKGNEAVNQTITGIQVSGSEIQAPAKPEKEVTLEEARAAMEDAIETAEASDVALVTEVAAAISAAKALPYSSTAEDFTNAANAIDEAVAEATAAAILADLNTAKTAVEGATYTLATADTNAQAAAKVKSAVEALTEVSSKSFTVAVTEVDYTAAVADTTDGEYKFTVKLTATDSQTVTTATITAVIPQ